MTETIKLQVDEVNVVKALYPRIKEDSEAIARYRNAIENLPPIVVARGRIIVDGYHRHQAHKLEGKTTINAVNLGDLTDTEILEEAIKRNSTH